MINPVCHSNPYNRSIAGVRIEKPSLSVDKLGFSLINPVDQQFTHSACHIMHLTVWAGFLLLTTLSFLTFLKVNQTIQITVCLLCYYLLTVPGMPCTIL